MGRIRYLVTMSLDGYIAGPQGEVDWIVSDPAVDFGALFAQFDTFLVGRRTFEFMNKPGSPPLPSGSKTFVFSRTLQNNHPGVSVLTEVSPSVISRIKAEAKKDICPLSPANSCSLVRRRDVRRSIGGRQGP